MQGVSHSRHSYHCAVSIRAFVTCKLQTLTARHLQQPQRFCCALHIARKGTLPQPYRYRQSAVTRAAKGESSKSGGSDPSAIKHKAKESSDSKSDKANSKTDSKADSKAESKAKSTSSKAEKAEQSRPDVSATASQGLKPVHLATFFIILGTGLMFLAVLLWFTADIRFQQACVKVIRRLFKTVALRQVMGILGAMTFVRFGLEPMVKMLRRVFRAPGSWEKSAEFYILREVWASHSTWCCMETAACRHRLAWRNPDLIRMLQVYRPLEFLFTIAAFTTLAENFLPQLIALPKVLCLEKSMTVLLHTGCQIHLSSFSCDVKTADCMLLLRARIEEASLHAGHDPELCTINAVTDICDSSSPCGVQHQSTYGTRDQLAA